MTARSSRGFACVLVFLVFVAAIDLAVCLSTAEARPGGGQSFGGSRSSGGSSGRSSSGSSGRSSGGSSGRSSSGGGSSRSSNNDSSSSNNWSNRPSYSSPWSAPKAPPPQPPRQGPHGGGGGNYVPPEAPSGSAFSYFFWLVFAALVVLVAVYGFKIARDRKEAAWASGVVGGEWSARASEPPAPPRPDKRFKTIAGAIRSLDGRDPRFSQVIFEDFLYALFTEVHHARGSGRVSWLAPYANDAVLAALEARTADDVSDIIVGAMRVEEIDVERASRKVLVTVGFTANYTERRSEVSKSSYVEEKWTLSRSVDVASRVPEKARVVGCPNCGAALDKLVADKCKYCNAVTKDADHDWTITSIEVLAQEERGPILTGSSEEVGTDAPTIVGPDARSQYDALVQRDPGITWSALSARIFAIFSTFHEAWKNRDLAPVRPFLSDGLFETQRYWVEAYKAQGLRNVTEGARIMGLQLSTVLSDASFDCITVRVFASCVDYTENESGAIVGGDRQRVRSYSEYWTLIRAATVRGAPKADATCPNCGAAADAINMAGECRSCRAKVTRGDFDWVLSRIEQDEVYELIG